MRILCDRCKKQNVDFDFRDEWAHIELSEKGYGKLGDYYLCPKCASDYRKFINNETVIEGMLKVGEWIPVTHEIDEESGEYMFTCQLPEEGERVIVVNRRGYIDIDEQCYDTDGWYLDGGDWNDIVAWMPLPEAYGGKESEE